MVPMLHQVWINFHFTRPLHWLSSKIIHTIGLKQYQTSVVVAKNSPSPQNKIRVQWFVFTRWHGTRDSLSICMVSHISETSSSDDQSSWKPWCWVCPVHWGWQVVGVTWWTSFCSNCCRLGLEKLTRLKLKVMQYDLSKIHQHNHCHSLF